MKIPDHVIDSALAEANKKLREVSERISNEVAQMTDFKVGDSVTLSGVVVSDSAIHWPDGYHRVEFCDGHMLDLPSYEMRSSVISAPDTTFRDQAAIAALQAMLINTDVSPGGDARAMAKSAFDLAEALDAERKKRGGS